MTATPHNGKEEDFQLFMSLLDADRFYGKFRDGAQVDVSDLDAPHGQGRTCSFDGRPLFPGAPRLHGSVQLSDARSRALRRRHGLREAGVRPADQLARRRPQGSVGFALTVAAAPPLASSPEAIYQSLKRRRNKLKRRVEKRLGQRGRRWPRPRHGHQRRAR